MASQEASGAVASALFGKYWAAVLAFGGGLMAWGQLNTQVAELKEAQSKDIANQEVIVEMRTEQKYMRQDIDNIEGKVDRILEKVGANRSSGNSSRSGPADSTER